MSIKKTDKRILHTKKFIRDALIELMKTKMISQISVLQLCRQADINRNTFYAHYATPEDVLIEIEDEITSQLNTITAASNDPQLESLLYIRNIKEELTVLCDNRSSRLSEKLQDYGSRSFELFFKSHGYEPDAASENLFLFIKGGNSAIVNNWIRNGCQESAETINEQITQLEITILDSLNRFIK